MNDRQINNLVRMAMEAEELEASSRGLRLVGAEDEAPARRAVAVSRGRWWVGAGLAAAAAVAGALLIPSVISPSGPTRPGDGVVVNPIHETVRPIVRHQPLNEPLREVTNATPVHPRVHEAPDLGSVEQCIVVTIYRDTKGGEHCVRFQPQVWSGNKCLPEVSPEELAGATIGRPCLAKINQTLVVALSGPQRVLPKNETDAQGLATCILGSRDCGSDSHCLMRAAEDCVPANVSVKLEAVAASR